MSDTEDFDDNVGTQKGKIWKLAGGVMTVVYAGHKKVGDKEMIIEIEFVFDHDPGNPRTVGEHKLIINKSKNKLGLSCAKLMLSCACLLMLT